MKVFKYPVSPSPNVQLLMTPPCSKILSAIEQDGQIMIYAEVPDPDASPIWNEYKRLLVIGTGWDFDAGRENDIRPFEDLRFIGTVKVDCFVWHVFELTDPKEADSE